MAKPDATIDAQCDREKLLRTWSDRPGLVGWLTTVDHKRIGRRYIATALVFFVTAGVLAMLMRIQLAQAENSFLGPDRYNQLFSMHGSMMMFLFAGPIMQAVAVYIVPLMVGARNIAFPRLNAFSYWVYLFGGIMILAAFVVGAGPEAGWTGNVPLSRLDSLAGERADSWALMIIFTGVAALCVAVQLLATILAMRAPGMTWRRIPLFVWSTLIGSLMVILATPSVMLGSTFLIADRMVGTQFYSVGAGGDALLGQSLFRFFVHPAMYILLLPAFGMISSIVETFARRPIFGYGAMVLSLAATGLLAFALSAQHMFAIGLPPLGGGLKTAVSMMIAIPAGVQVFCWIATLWTGRPIVTVPLLFVLGSVALFVPGGMTGVMAASAPLDMQLHDSDFVVAQLHYLLIGGAVFPLMGALYYWFPKFTGRMLSESLGRMQFWLFFIGVNVTFLPMYILGLNGMPHRVYTYPAGLGWDLPNMVASLGSWIVAGSVLVFAFNVFYALRAGRPAGDNPWGAPTLEWATLSPPAPYNFEETPVVRDSEPLWPLDAKLPVMSGLAKDSREALLTTPIDALPAARWAMPEPSPWPLLLALALTLLFVWSILSPWGVAWGSIPLAIALTAWCWPRRAGRGPGGAG